MVDRGLDKQWEQQNEQIEHVPWKTFILFLNTET